MTRVRSSAPRQREGRENRTYASAWSASSSATSTPATKTCWGNSSSRLRSDLNDPRDHSCLARKRERPTPGIASLLPVYQLSTNTGNSKTASHVATQKRDQPRRSAAQRHATKRGETRNQYSKTGGCRFESCRPCSASPLYKPVPALRPNRRGRSRPLRLANV